MISSEQITHHRQTLQLWEAMGREPVAPSTERTDRRKRPRFLTPHAQCQLDVIEAECPQTIEVVVRDVGTGGACLLSSRSLPTRQAVRIHPPTDAQREVEAVVGWVISCRRRSHGYRIGVKFSEGE